jgi:hypothetical protein
MEKAYLVIGLRGYIIGRFGYPEGFVRYSDGVGLSTQANGHQAAFLE